MTKESRLMIRLIALWIIFAISLGVTAWGAEKLVVAFAKTANGGYETDYTVAGYGGTSYCLQMPAYPAVSSGYNVMSGTPEQTSSDKALMDQYNQDLVKYYDNLQTKCLEVTAKQIRSASIGDITGAFVMLILGLATVIVSLTSITITEKA